MEVQFKKHVRIILDLEKGDVVRTDGWGKPLDGKDHTIVDIKPNIGNSESGFMVMISGYDGWLDSNWLIKPT